MICLKKKILYELKVEIEKTLNGRILFSILYGGFCYNKLTKDIDLLAILKDKPTQKDISLIKKAIINISNKHKIHLDEEVRYEKKLLISKNRLKKIFNLSAFKKRNKFCILRITGKNYLNSDKFLDRLFLNALTSPNILLCGSKKEYEYYTKLAFIALKKLAKCLCKKTDNKDLIEVLMPKKGVFFKDYLGYQNITIVKNKLKGGLGN